MHKKHLPIVEIIGWLDLHDVTSQEMRLEYYELIHEMDVVWLTTGVLSNFDKKNLEVKVSGLQLFGQRIGVNYAGASSKGWGSQLHHRSRRSGNKECR